LKFPFTAQPKMLWRGAHRVCAAVAQVAHRVSTGFFAASTLAKPTGEP
jgi:hypothetical protein